MMNDVCIKVSCVYHCVNLNKDKGKEESNIFIYFGTINGTLTVPICTATENVVNS